MRAIVDRNSRYSICDRSFPINAPSHNVSILHRFRDTTTFTVYVKLQATCAAFRFICRHIVVNTCQHSRGMGVRKVHLLILALYNSFVYLTFILT